MQTQSIEYRDGDTILEGYLAWEGDDPKPAVLVAHDWTGCRDFAKGKAEEMAKLGYVGFAIDMYGKGVFGDDGNVELNSSLMNPLAGDRAALRARMQAAVDTVRDLPQVDAGKVAAMGYCFGGMCVIELARAGSDALGVISVHGIFSPGGVPNETITARVLCLHGHDDPMVPPEQVLDFEVEMSEAGADWQVHAYGGTMHAFTNPAANDPGFGTQYNATADKRSARSIINFLDEVFG